jgi:hypothetical protein
LEVACLENVEFVRDSLQTSCLGLFRDFSGMHIESWDTRLNLRKHAPLISNSWDDDISVVAIIRRRLTSNDATVDGIN